MSIHLFILGESNTRRLSPTNNCREHGKELKFFCNSCKLSICESCWEKDHGDVMKHPIRLFESILKPEKDVCDRMSDHTKQATQFRKQFKNFCDQLVTDARDLEEKQGQVSKSTNNEQLMNGKQVVKAMVATQSKAVTSIQTELNKQCDLIKESLENLLPSDGDEEKKESANVQTHSSEQQKERNETVTSQIRIRKRRNLKSVRRKLKCEENCMSSEAVYNWSTRQLICSEIIPNVVRILGVNSEKKSLTVERKVTWEGDKRGELSGIAMTSDNTLYASILSRSNKRWRVSVLRQESDLREEREIDTTVIREEMQRPDSRDYNWELRGCGDKMSIVTRLDNWEERVYSWECAYIYSEERCTQRVRLDIERDLFSSHLCYIGSHLIVKTRENVVAVVPLRSNNITGKDQKEKQKKSRDTSNGDEDNCNSNLQNRRREKEKKYESGKMEESRAGGIKHVTLQDIEFIDELVWVRRDKNDVEDGMEHGGSFVRHTTTNCDGYLFVGDNPGRGRNKCSVYELNLDRVKDGDRLNSKKHLEIDASLPKCMIDNSNLFAMEGNPRNGNPTILTLEFN